MQTNFDKANGVGVIRFWAGYYDTDNNGSLGIQISKNAGQTWETVVASQPIAKDWKEYQFVINQTGNLRVRIIKAETGSSGINVDKIRISDYVAASNTDNPVVKVFTCNSQADGLHIQLMSTIGELVLYNLSGQKIRHLSHPGETVRIAVTPGVYVLSLDGVSYKLICN